MRADKTILSISFLFLAAAIFAGEAEISNELPDEIKNLTEDQVLYPYYSRITFYPERALSEGIYAEVWVKFKIIWRRPDSATVAYCSKSGYEFENAALIAVREAKYRLTRDDNSLRNQWLYTKVVFDPERTTHRVKTKKIDSTSIGTGEPRVACTEENQKMPEIKKRGVPKYPRIARQNNINGKVIVRVLIDESGRPIDALVQETTDAGWQYGFNEAALDGALKCKFKPATCGGKPVKIWVSFPYEFKLYGNR